jgi:hypothetical protein
MCDMFSVFLRARKKKREKKTGGGGEGKEIQRAKKPI